MEEVRNEKIKRELVCALNKQKNTRNRERERIMVKILKKLGNGMLSFLLACSLLTVVPVSAEENLINTSKETDITVVDFSSQCTTATIGEDAEATYVLDYNGNSYWHSDWRNSKKVPQHLTFNLAKVYNLTDVAFQARQGSAYANGDIFKANVYVGMTQDNMALVGTYSFDRNGYFLANREEFKHMAMNAVGQFVKVEAVETGGDGGQLNMFASMGEIRFYGTEYVEPEVVDKTALVQAITDAQAAYGEEETYTVDSFAPFKAAYEAAIVVNENADATQVAVNNAATALVNAKAALVVKPRELTDLINKEANAVTVESYSSQCGGAGEPSEGSGGGQASKTVDYNEDTYWHSNYNTSNGQKHTITYNLGKEYTLKDVTFTPRKGGRNGDIHKFEVYVGNSTDYTQNTLTGEYVFATSGTLTEGQWYRADVLAKGEFIGQYVTIRITGSYGDSGNNQFASMGEIRFYGTEYVAPVVVDKTALNAVIASAKVTVDAGNDAGTYTEGSWEALSQAYAQAQVVAENDEATQEEVDEAKEQLEAAVENLTIAPADYSAVNAAIEAARALDASLYTNFDAVTAAIDAVVEGKDITKQAEVDAMAKAINDAVAALTYKGADYSAVNTAIEAARALDANLYTNFDAVTAAIDAVVEGKDITKQAEVDAMVKAINDAVAALTYKGADYSAVNAAIEAARALDASLYTNFDAVTAAINAVVEGKDITKQAEVDAMAKAINDAVAALTYKGADYSAVNAAIEAANALDSNLYTNFDAVTAAINAVVEGKDITKQAEVDAMAKAINDAVAALTYKGADYSAVNAAIEAARALDANLYTNFDAVTAAINAVVEGKNITEQAEVDGYAAAILAAIENLVPVPSQSTTLVATATNYKTITLTWDAVEGASYYEVYRQNTKTGLWIKLADATTNTYVVNGVKTGKEYTYKVIAMQTLDEGTSVITESNEAKGKAMLTGAPTLSATMEGSSRFVLNWTQVEGATRYIIYRKEENGTYKKILTLGADATTYTSNSMMPGTYFYVVKAARYDGSERMMSEASNEVEVQSTASTSQLEVVENATGAQLTWTAIEGMKYYEVYVSAANQDAYRRVKVQSTTTYNTQSLKAGVTYNFKVRGYRINNDAKVYSAYSNVVTYTAK